MTVNELQLLKKKLDRGFFADNLYEMASICENLSRDPSVAPAFYILRSVFLEIARDWNDRPLPVEEAGKVQEKLQMPIKEVIRCIETLQSKEVLFNSLTKVVFAMMQAL